MWGQAPAATGAMVRMSSPSHLDEPSGFENQGRSSMPAKIIAGVVAVVVAIFGISALTKGDISTTTAATGFAPQAAPGARGGSASGSVPQGMPPGGFGTPVSGATLTKLKAAV